MSTYIIHVNVREFYVLLILSKLYLILYIIYLCNLAQVQTIDLDGYTRLSPHLGSLPLESENYFVNIKYIINYSYLSNCIQMGSQKLLHQDMSYLASIF